MTGNDATHDGKESATDVFALAPLDYGAIRGERTFESVLYSRENAKDRVPLDVRTGKPTVGVSSEEKAKRVAENKNHAGCQCVDVPKTPEPMGESRSAPYVPVVFYNEKVVSGKVVGKDDYGIPQFENDGRALEWTYRAAVQSDDYEVQLVAADYQTGNVTIRVTATDNRPTNPDEDDPIAVFMSERAPGWEWQAFCIDRKTPETIWYGRVRSPLTRGRWEWGTFSQSDLDTADAREVESR